MYRVPTVKQDSDMVEPLRKTLKNCQIKEQRSSTFKKNNYFPHMKENDSLLLKNKENCVQKFRKLGIHKQHDPQSDGEKKRVCLKKKFKYDVLLLLQNSPYGTMAIPVPRVLTNCVLESVREQVANEVWHSNHGTC
jgi:hypothetical protein